MKDNNLEAERAAPGITDPEIAGIMGWRGPGAYTEATLRKIRRVLEEDRQRRAPAVGEDGLPPLPAPSTYGEQADSYTDGPLWDEEAVRHAQLDAVAADRVHQKARIMHLTHERDKARADLLAYLALQPSAGFPPAVEKAVIDCAATGIGIYATHYKIERRRDLVHAPLPLDAEVALEHAALALDKVGDQGAHDHVVQVLAAHLPPEDTEGGTND